VVQLCSRNGRIQINQAFTGSDGLAVVNVDRANNGGLEGLDGLGSVARDDLARSDSNNVDGSKAGPEQGDNETAVMLTTMVRPTGEGGVSMISSAAGRKASASLG